MISQTNYIKIPDQVGNDSKKHMKSKEIDWRVKDFMRLGVITLTPKDSMKKAMEIMIRENTNGIVVVDKKRKVVGILSSWDIIKYIVPDYLEEDKHLASFEAPDVFKTRTIAISKDPVSKFMSQPVHCVHPDSSIMEAAATLSTFHLRQLPVVDKTGHLVGYLNKTDIKLAVGMALGFKVDKPEN